MRATSRCTTVTSGQVASKTQTAGLASVRTDWGTPWALKMTVLPAGTSSRGLHEDGALGAQALDDEAVVDDFVADVDRCAELGQGAFDDLDGAFDAGAETAGLASRTSMLFLGGGSVDADDSDFEADGLAGQRVVEVDGGVGRHFADQAGVAGAVRGGEP